MWEAPTHTPGATGKAPSTQQVGGRQPGQGTELSTCGQAAPIAAVHHPGPREPGPALGFRGHWMSTGQGTVGLAAAQGLGETGLIRELPGPGARDLGTCQAHAPPGHLAKADCRAGAPCRPQGPPGLGLGLPSPRPLPGFHQHVTSRQGTPQGRVGNAGQHPLGKGSPPLWGQQTGVRGLPPHLMYRISLAAPAPWGDTCLRPGLGNLGEAQKGGERHSQAAGRGPAPGRTPDTA